MVVRVQKDKMGAMKINQFITWSVLLISISFFSSGCCMNSQLTKLTVTDTKKKFDLVLVHGLANRHHWSQSFLDTCLSIWGSGKVFVVYTNESVEISEKIINGRILTYCGGSGLGAGTQSIAQQSNNLALAIETLKESGYLSLPFSIIAHSMGGLVARQYSYENPGFVAGLVTLGTPHHGSPIADSFKWAGYFINAQDAIEDLKPKNMVKFNSMFPVASTPFAVNDKLYLIRGDCDGFDCFGWAGELLLGYHILSVVYDTDSDGLVPTDSAIIEGAECIKDFIHFDHFDLVLEHEVAETAAGYLP